MSEEAKTIIAPIITKNGVHVMSNSEEYASVSAYFSTPDFASYAANAEVDPDMLCSISEGMTNFLREQSTKDPILSWASSSIAVCDNAKVGKVIDSEDIKVVFTLKIEETP